jgi:hypothetical protein
MSLLAVACFGLTNAQSQEMPKPSPEHAYLKKTATHKVEMLGDFWTVGKFVGDIPGMKFEGRDSGGWDPRKKMYVGTWIDSMSPHSMTLYGKYDEANKTMTMEGLGVNEQGKDAKFKEVIVWKNDNEYNFSLSEEKDGKFVEIFSMLYKRKK